MYSDFATYSVGNDSHCRIIAVEEGDSMFYVLRRSPLADTCRNLRTEVRCQLGSFCNPRQA